MTSNIQYPAAAQRAKVSGRVIVQFVINTDGTLTDINILNGVSYDLDAEALRVVKRMNGRWKPAVQRGRLVKTRFNLPLAFAMQ
ncbi:MAG: energy transducer TonB [Cytophagaceae bacterium]|nr:energy transducer TonB [Cytophagaceae bacterium]